MAHLNLRKSRIDHAKRAFSTRRVPRKAYQTLLTGKLVPKPGDLVLARVDEIGKQTKLELTDGRRAHMFPGDEIIVCYGNRYAPDQYEAQIGQDLSPCDLVAAGGLAAVELSRHQRMKPPTQITPLGLLGDAKGRRLNLSSFGVDATDAVPQIPAILSLGTSMNAGKTLTATSLVRGFKRLGFKVGALKITGTGAGGDMWIVRDAGADVALDFTDAGFASTYLVGIPEIEAATYRLMNHAAAQGCDVCVIEIADGLQQLETSQLIRSPQILDVTIGTVFAAYDAMGAKYGVDVLRAAGHSVLAMSGRLGRSPLGVREAEAATGLRVFSPWELQEGALMTAIRERAAAACRTRNAARPALEALAQAAVPANVALGNLVPMGPAAADARRIGLSGTSLARDILDRVAHHVMQAEADQLCGVAYGAHAAGRRDWRNGVRPQDWITDFGVIELRVPRLRKTRYEPAFPRQAAAPIAALKAAIDARHGDFDTAVQRLCAGLAKGGRFGGDLDRLLDELRRMIDAARLQGLPLAAPMRVLDWPLPGPAENGGIDEDEIFDGGTGFLGGLESDHDRVGVGELFQNGFGVTAAE